MMYSVKGAPGRISQLLLMGNANTSIDKFASLKYASGWEGMKYSVGCRLRSIAHIGVGCR